MAENQTDRREESAEASGRISAGNASKAFLEHLDRSGFFQQITGLENNLKAIADDLKVLGDSTLQRLHETESLVAHVLAIEAVLQVLLKDHPVAVARVKALVKERTAGLSDNTEGSPAVLSVVDEILANPKG